MNETSEGNFISDLSKHDEEIAIDHFKHDVRNNRVGGVSRVPAAFHNNKVKYKSVLPDNFVIEPGEKGYSETTDSLKHTKRVRELITRDQLTGLYNKSAFLDRLQTEMDRSKKLGTKLAVVMCDLDDFKKINDTFGHITGDYILKSIGDLLVRKSRKKDTVGRFGGDEFVLIFSDIDVEKLMNILSRMNKSVKHRDFSSRNGRHFKASISLGATWLENDDKNVSELLDRADTALYRCKEAGRDCIKIVSKRDK